MSTKDVTILKSREKERKSSKTARASRGQELKWKIPVGEIDVYDEKYSAQPGLSGA